jgi:hypothetical protein
MSARKDGTQPVNHALPLRRTVIFPSDLFNDLEKLARRDGFNSVQGWLVCTLQQKADAELTDDALRRLHPVKTPGIATETQAGQDRPPRSDRPTRIDAPETHPVVAPARA